MMETVITSSALILVVILLRAVFREKISRRLRYALWLVVLLRLLLPFPLMPSQISMMNAVSLPQGLRQASSSAAVMSEDAATGRNTAVNTGQPGEVFPAIPAREGTAPSPADIRKTVWLAGAAAAGLWFFLSNLLFYRKLQKYRVPYEAKGCPLRVYRTDFLPSPCLFGLIFPAVYLTGKAIKNRESEGHVIAHELCHYAHGDHIWSLLRGVCLSLYWFNPLVWAAAALSYADGELACDEGAVKRLGEENKIAYGRTLVGLIDRKPSPAAVMRAATTMTSGKRGIKERVRLIAKNPKTLIPALIVTLLIVGAAVGCTFTGAKNAENQLIPLEQKIASGLADENPLVRRTWEMIKSDIASNEQTSEEIFGEEGAAFTDAEITKLERTDSFDNMVKDAVIEVYALQYRMYPKDMSKIMLAGGMDVKDGWLLSRCSMGDPYLVAKKTGAEITYLGTIYPEGEGQGVPAATRELLNRLEARNGRINADEVEEIRLRMHYQGKAVSGNIVYPKENAQGIGEIVDLLNAVSSTGEKSVNGFPPYDRVIEVTLIPVKTAYLYEKDGRCYAEVPYESIGEMTKEAYEQIRENFGPIRPFPEDMDKTVFLPAIRDMLEGYRSGNPPENPMEYKFDEAPDGVLLPYVNSIDDFELTDGNAECLYTAVIPFGEKNAYEIIMQLNLLTPGDESGWTVSGVFFGGAEAPKG